MTERDAHALARLAAETRAEARRSVVRIYVAGALWIVAVAGVVAASAGVTQAVWFAFPSAVLASVVSSMARSPVLRQLQSHGGEHALPIIADHIEDLAASHRKRALSVLRRLLPTMLEPDAPVLTDTQWDGLAWVLRTADVEREADIIVVLLNVMAAKAPTRLVSAVEQHAMGPAPTLPETRVRIAARAALGALAERARDERAAHILVRPAEPLPDPNLSLLRPADGVPGADETLLVRPVDEAQAPPKGTDADRP